MLLGPNANKERKVTPSRCDCRVAHPFAEAGSCFSASAKGWDSIHYSSRASVHDTSLRARLQSCQKSSSKRTLPWAAGSRAAAPGKRFVLLGRNAAKRAKKDFENQRIYTPSFAPQSNVIPFCAVKRISHCSFPHSCRSEERRV